MLDLNYARAPLPTHKARISPQVGAAPRDFLTGL